MQAWFAIYVQSRHEKSVASMLRFKGYETCLPLIKSRREWLDRTKLLDLPAFPGYLFCEFDPEKRAPVLSTPGVVSIVGAGKSPVPISSAEVEALQAIERSKAIGEELPYLEVGQKVRIEGGALDGLSGILSDCRKKSYVVVSVGLLQRSIGIEVDRLRIFPLAAA